MIELRGVLRSFPRPGRRRGGFLPVLDVPTLDVAAGTCLRVRGPNGVGKTTLLHLLAGLLRPDAGTVRIAGTDIVGLGEAQLDRFRARGVGYVLQNAWLLDGLSARENVAAALLFGGAARGGRMKRAEALLDRLGVGHRAAHQPHQLSGGERQKVALARALANDPPLLLADEPFASLDRAAADGLARDLESLVREEGRTLVLVSHGVGEGISVDQELDLGDRPEVSA